MIPDQRITLIIYSIIGQTLEGGGGGEDRHNTKGGQFRRRGGGVTLDECEMGTVNALFVLLTHSL